jgi:hypothetical protein
MSLTFDAESAQKRIDKFWQLSASFGMERNAYHNYLNEIVSDRYALINGLQLLRDELQHSPGRSDQTLSRCGGIPLCYLVRNWGT